MLAILNSDDTAIGSLSLAFNCSIVFLILIVYNVWLLLHIPLVLSNLVHQLTFLFFKELLEEFF